MSPCTYPTLILSNQSIHHQSSHQSTVYYSLQITSYQFKSLKYLLLNIIEIFIIDSFLKFWQWRSHCVLFWVVWTPLLLLRAPVKCQHPFFVQLNLHELVVPLAPFPQLLLWLPHQLARFTHFYLQRLCPWLHQLPINFILAQKPLSARYFTLWPETLNLWRVICLDILWVLLYQFSTRFLEHWWYQIFLELDIDVNDVFHFFHIVHQFFWVSFSIVFLFALRILVGTIFFDGFSEAFTGELSFFQRYFFLWLAFIQWGTRVFDFDQSFFKALKVESLLIELSLVLVWCAVSGLFAGKMVLILFLCFFSAFGILRNGFGEEVFWEKFRVKFEANVFG